MWIACQMTTTERAQFTIHKRAIIQIYQFHIKWNYTIFNVLPFFNYTIEGKI